LVVEVVVEVVIQVFGGHKAAAVVPWLPIIVFQRPQVLRLQSLLVQVEKRLVFRAPRQLQ
jgi:hypothetical protein